MALSHTKSIKGADGVIGWVEPSGQATLRDFHSVDGRTVSEDESQDYELVVGYEDEGLTVLRFRRKIETCDSDFDLSISNDTFRVIWAYSDEDSSNSSRARTPLPRNPISKDGLSHRTM